MTLPEDFAAFILTHGRPHAQQTLATLKTRGYTGRFYLVVDDEDETLAEYQKLYGDQVLVFSKRETLKTFDVGDNFGGPGSHSADRVIVFARNVVWDLAESLGHRYFIVLDDDYTSFRFRWNERLTHEWIEMTDLDSVLAAMLDWFRTLPEQVVTVAMSQGGDWIGGEAGQPYIHARRKAMNSFICDTRRRFEFPGRLNEDVNAYTEIQRRGLAMFTVFQVQLLQQPTQKQAGGMTDAYQDGGTYVKSFYSIMRCPSAARISYLHPRFGRVAGGVVRIHHRVTHNHCAPRIIPEAFQKKAGGSRSGVTRPS